MTDSNKIEHWLCTQVIVQSQTNEIVRVNNVTNNNTNIIVSCITRRVQAVNKAEAIGKFIIATKNINAIKRLDVECNKASLVIEIK